MKNASWLFSGGMGASLFAIIEVAVLARFLGLEQFGTFNIVIAYVSIVNGLIDLRVGEAVIKYVGQHWERKATGKALSFIKLFYLIDFLSGVVAFAVVLLLADVANRVFIKSDIAFELILIYSFSLLVSTVNNNSKAVLRVFNRFRNIAFVEVFHVGLRVVFVVAALIVGFGIKGALAAYVAAAFVNFAILQLAVSRALNSEALGHWINVKLEYKIEEIKNLIWFILHSTASGFVNRVFNKNFPILILGHFSGSEASGLYKAAGAFSKVVGKLKGPSQKAIYPILVGLEVQRDYKTFKKIIAYSTSFLMKLFIPMGAVFFIFADTIIRVFFGAEYAPAASAMRIIIVVEVLSGLFFWVPSAYLALGKVRTRTGVTLLSATSYAMVLLYLVPLYSYDGAAIARLAVYVIILPASLMLFRSVRKGMGKHQ